MTYYPQARERKESGWCCRWEFCGGIGVPCYVGGRRAELCEACDAEDQNQQPQEEKTCE